MGLNGLKNVSSTETSSNILLNFEKELKLRRNGIQKICIILEPPCLYMYRVMYILYVLTCNIAFQGNNFTGGRLDHQRPNGLQKSQFFVIAK